MRIDGHKMMAITLLSIYSTWGCSFRNNAEDGPEEYVSLVRAYLNSGDWESYWNSFSEEGKGWLVCNVATAFSWDAGAQPINPKNGEDSQRFLRKYNLGIDVIRLRDGESVKEFKLRLARHIGDRGPDMCREMYTEGDYGHFPEDGIICVAERRDARSVIAINNGSKFVVTKVSGRWYIDGNEDKAK